MDKIIGDALRISSEHIRSYLFFKILQGIKAIDKRHV